MKTGDAFTIRTMTRREIELAVEWAALEGWNPGLRDAGCFYRTDPDGFLVGLLGNEPIAVISVVSYGDSFGFLGFYIVKPEYRGKGYGLAIWKSGMEKLEGRTVGLDGVVSRQEDYRKSGFEFAWNNMRFMGSGGGGFSIPSSVTPLSELPFDDVVRYDSRFFPEIRKSFLECWIEDRSGHTSLGYVEEGRLSGYGVLRNCRNGCKIGPLFADNPGIAETLFAALKSSIPESAQLYLDIPAINPAALELVKRHDMKVVFETARMYRGTAPHLPTDRIFGITTFELG